LTKDSPAVYSPKLFRRRTNMKELIEKVLKGLGAVALIWAGILQYQQVNVQKQQSRLQASQIKPQPVVEIEGTPKLKGGGGDWGLYGRVRVTNEGLKPAQIEDYDTRFHDGWSYNSWYWEWMRTNEQGGLRLPIILKGKDPNQQQKPFVSFSLFGYAAAEAETRYCGPNGRPFFLRVRLKLKGEQLHRFMGFKFTCMSGPSGNMINYQSIPVEELPEEPEQAPK
jgi:hypothetical protein